jgi:hypothetical protein
MPAPRPAPKSSFERPLWLTVFGALCLGALSYAGREPALAPGAPAMLETPAAERAATLPPRAVPPAPPTPPPFESLSSAEHARTADARKRALKARLHNETVAWADGRALPDEVAQPQAHAAPQTLPVLDMSREVHVRGYTQRDGTYVRPHNRGEP